MVEKSLKDLEKRVSELEKHDKQERQIFTRIAVNAGVVAPGASFKEVRKVYKKCTPKARYARVPDRRNQLDDKNIIDM